MTHNRAPRATRPLRILFFPRESFPNNRVRLTALFGRELLGRGHQIDFVMQARDVGTEIGRHEWYGRSVWIGPTSSGTGFRNRVYRHLQSIWHDLQWLWRCDPALYDCILISDKFLLSTVAPLVARLRGLQCFFWMSFPYHDSDLVTARNSTWPISMLYSMRGRIGRFLLFRWIVPCSDHIFVQSTRMKEDFCSRGADPKRVTPIATGIDLDDVHLRFHSHQRRPSHPLTIAYLGTLSTQRHLDMLVDMLAILRKDGVDARLLLIGDGHAPPDRAVIEDRANTLGVRDFIEITGFLPRDAALERVRSSDVCVSPFFPSPILDVASPTKLVEYLALGMPVVANSHPDQSQVLRESRAGVCVPWGARHFARAVSWLARRQDVELATMATRGRAWVEAHRSYSSIADEFERACYRSDSQNSRSE